MKVVKNLEVVVVANFKVLIGVLSGETEKNHE
jgi:hypothetical protein